MIIHYEHSATTLGYNIWQQHSATPVGYNTRLHQLATTFGNNILYLFNNYVYNDMLIKVFVRRKTVRQINYCMGVSIPLPPMSVKSDNSNASNGLKCDEYGTSFRIRTT